MSSEHRQKISDSLKKLWVKTGRVPEDRQRTIEVANGNGGAKNGAVEAPTVQGLSQRQCEI